MTRFAPPDMTGAALARRIAEGTVFQSAPVSASRALTDAAWTHVCRAFGPDSAQDLAPASRTAARHAILAASNDGAFQRVLDLRTEMAADPALRALCQNLAGAFGLTGYTVDPPQLRALVPGAHRLKAARHAFTAHRDTWYGYPGGTVNIWLALSKCVKEATFVFYMDMYRTHVPNDAAGFHASRWRQNRGEAMVPQDIVYPAARDLHNVGPATGFAAQPADVLLFSAQHLHHPRGHDEALPRLSLDFRLIPGGPA